MNFEKLKSTPNSGDFDEKHFGKTDPNPLWIKFYSTNSESWIGSFASGDIGLINEKIFEIDQTSKIGILINGAFYLIDKNAKDVLLNPEHGFFTDFEISSVEDLIFLATDWGIYVIKDKEQIKVIRPDFIDGVRFTKKTDKLLIGEIYEPGDNWSEFELNMHTLKLKWGQYEF
jgi:hypothetical protein